jgi:hypothetical protein
MKIRPAVVLAAIVHLSPESDEKTRKEEVGATPQLPRRNLFH